MKSIDVFVINIFVTIGEKDLTGFLLETVASFDWFCPTRGRIFSFRRWICGTGRVFPLHSPMIDVAHHLALLRCHRRSDLVR